MFSGGFCKFFNASHSTLNPETLKLLEVMSHAQSRNMGAPVMSSAEVPSTGVLSTTCSN